MFAGEWYNANHDPNLIDERLRVKDLCFELNAVRPSDLERRAELLKKILPHVEVSGVEILSPFVVDYGYNIRIGAGSFFNHNCYLMDCASIEFGTHCFVGPNCGFYTALHPLIVEKRNEGLERALPIKIENDVWIGGGVTIMPGVTVGAGSVIGAGSIVTKNIPAGVIAYGNPCKPIRPVVEKNLIV